MLNRLFRKRWVVCPPLLLTLVCSLMIGPGVANAQTAGSSKGPAIVLVIPAQKTAEVPDSVAGNIEQNLRALMEIDSSLKLLLSAQRDPGPDFAVPAPPPPDPEPVVKPLPENPGVAVARASLDKARELVAKKSWEQALGRLIKVKDTFARFVADTEDLSALIDAHALTAVAFVNGGFNEEGNQAVKALLTIQPDFDVSGAAYSDKFRAAVERVRGKLPEGGDLVVSVTPEDALVYVDGRLVGKGTQVVTGLAKGRHFVRVAGDTLFPAGGSVTTNGPGSPVTVKYNLKSRVEKPEPVVVKKPEIKSGPRPLVWYARSGMYAEPGFSRDVKAEAAEVFADYVLFSFYARTNDKFHVGAFVASALNGEIVAVKPAVINLDLGNLYVELLDLEKRIQMAVADASTGAKVAAQPEIYRMVQAKPKPVPAPAPVPAPVPTPAPAPAPVVAKPAPSGLPDDFPMNVPSDFPVSGRVQNPAPAPTSNYYGSQSYTVSEEPVVEQKTPVYKKWWFWTIIGIAVAGAAAGAAVGVIYGDDGGSANVGGGIRW